MRWIAQFLCYLARIQLYVAQLKLNNYFADIILSNSRTFVQNIL
jgi:hypothetical protein